MGGECEFIKMIVYCIVFIFLHNKNNIIWNEKCDQKRMLKKECARKVIKYTFIDNVFIKMNNPLYFIDKLFPVALINYCILY